jgi:hypothetical protein
MDNDGKSPSAKSAKKREKIMYTVVPLPVWAGLDLGQDLARLGREGGRP